jgi:hypothetical protein
MICESPMPLPCMIPSSRSPAGLYHARRANLWMCTLAIVGMAVVTVTSGCATMLANKTPEVRVQSDPDGARVYVNGEFAGNTPVKLHLAANRTYTIGFYKRGFEPKTFRLNNHAGTAWIVLDVLGGLWPIAVDMATGAYYELDTTDVRMSLPEASADQAGGNASNPWTSGPGEAQGSPEVVSVATRDGRDHRGSIIVDKPNDFIVMQLLDGSIVTIQYRDVDRRTTVSEAAPRSEVAVVAVPRGETPLEPLYLFQGKTFAPSSYDLLVGTLESERPDDPTLKALVTKYRTERQREAGFRAGKPLLCVACITAGTICGVLGFVESSNATTLADSTSRLGLGFALALALDGVGIGVIVAPSSPLPSPNEVVSYYNTSLAGAVP